MSSEFSGDRVYAISRHIDLKRVAMLKFISVMLVIVAVAWFLLSPDKSREYDLIIKGPDVYDRMIPTRQDINLSDPPSGVVPPQWKPGEPTIDPGDITSTENRHSEAGNWFKRWLRRLCCAIFSCKPDPPDKAPKDTDPTIVKVGVNVDGIPATSVIVPDTVGDIGPDYYIQAVNSAFQIFDTSGTPVSQTTYIRDLWFNVDSPCGNDDPVDPIVRYDRDADRWLISGFVWNLTVEDYLCIAVSQSGNPVTGGWYLYEIMAIDQGTDQLFPLDFPKISVHPDAFFLSTVRSYFLDLGLDVWALERSRMLDGLPAGLVRFHLSAPTVALLPGDLDGSPPPTNSPAWFARHLDDDRINIGDDRVEVFAYSVDWAIPGNSTFTLTASLPVDPFDSIICTPDLLDVCVPQPDTTQELETLSIWPQWRLQYRYTAEHESLLFNHTIDVDGSGHAGIRWYELRRPSAGNWSVYQQGTHHDDEMNYFMGSISMDMNGNIALGYSASSEDVYPSIHIAHRMVTDAPGMMPGVEYVAEAGTGSQTSGNLRWGNYSTMDVDPVDDCTFWYTNEYYKVSSEAGWLTKIVSFKLPGCE